MCVCVCVRARTHAHMPVCMYVHSVHTFIYMYYLRVYVYKHVRVYLHMYVHRSFQKFCVRWAERYSVSYDWTQIMCSAAATTVQCLCDASCCLAVDQRRLQGNSSWTDIRKLIKFHVVLNKSALGRLHIIEGRFRDTSSFIWNCSPVDECHS